jgi:hypothetical protein
MPCSGVWLVFPLSELRRINWPCLCSELAKVIIQPSILGYGFPEDLDVFAHGFLVDTSMGYHEGMENQAQPLRPACES